MSRPWPGGLARAGNASVSSQPSQIETARPRPADHSFSGFSSSTKSCRAERAVAVLRLGALMEQVEVDAAAA